MPARAVLFVISMVVIAVTASGQVKNSAAQELPSVIQQFMSYTDRNLQEKLFVHTDRSFYLTGEIMWMRLYYVDGFGHKPLDFSKVAYVELVDENRKAVLQSKIALTREGGNGTLFLPVSLNSGRYVLRAYTQGMRNYSPDMYFRQAISIVNPFVNEISRQASASPKYDIQFFPEGGNLVAGISSVVAFRVVDQAGKGINFRGIVLNEKNDTVATFKPLRSGMGRFNLIPEGGRQYRAVLVDEKMERFNEPLPRVFDSGVVMRLSRSGERLVVGLEGTAPAGSSPTVYMLAHTRQEVVVFDEQFLRDGKAEFSIALDALADGVSYVTIFDQSMTPLGERLYFKRPTQPLDIEIRCDSAFQTRQRVDISLTTHIGANTAGASLSASIYMQDSASVEGPDIESYLLLTSDLRGKVEDPGYYLEKEPTPERDRATDNLMLTHGWSRFTWKDVFGDPLPHPYLHEQGGHLFVGQVTDGQNKRAADVLTFLTNLGPGGRPHMARSNKEGKVYFEVRDIYGPSELILQTHTKTDSLYSIALASPFSEKHSEFPLAKWDLQESARKLIEQRSIHVQVQNIFFGNERNLRRNVVGDSSSFYGRPHESYNLDDYTRFTTMEEVMREYVRGVVVRKRRDGFHFFNLDVTNKEIFTNPPLVLIDGVPVFDIDRVIEFDPLQVNSIEVVKRRYYWGPTTFDGVVVFRTYKNDLGNFQLDSRTQAIRYDGLQYHREFFSPRYESTQQITSTKPDTRNLLFWAPSLTTGKDGKLKVDFYASDLAGKYKVVIQGMTEDGVTGHSSTTFEVKRQSQ